MKTVITGLLKLSVLAVAVLMASCSDSKSYSELLTDEGHYINAFLADQRVSGSIPADTVFETGVNAPYYKLDEDGYVYMQVINPGTPGNKAKDDDLIYFRFERYNLKTYYEDGKLGSPWGNQDDVALMNSSFRFNNYTLQSSAQWGQGLQMPLKFLPVDCEVNLVIKSAYGLTQEETNVLPFLYHVRYFRPQI